MESEGQVEFIGGFLACEDREETCMMLLQLGYSFY